MTGDARDTPPWRKPSRGTILCPPCRLNPPSGATSLVTRARRANLPYHNIAQRGAPACVENESCQQEVTSVRTSIAAVVLATVEQPGTGHHHLFVDRDLTWVNDTIPKGSPGILHLGRGQTEFALDSLTPGRHRVIAVIADWRHIPLNPLVADTVTFTVK